jgi:hypothetical protein
MRMGTLQRRVEHAGRLVANALARDVRARRTHRRDAALCRESDLPPCRFTADQRLGARELPARSVPLQPLSAYARSVAASISAALSARSVGHAFLPDEDGWSTRVQLDAASWTRAIAAVLDAVPGSLVGCGGQGTGASSVDYFDHLPEGGVIEEADSAFILVPAAVRRGGGVVKRFGFDAAVRLDRWVPAEGSSRLVATQWNASTSILDASAFRSDPDVGDAARVTGARQAATSAHLMEITFPIDAVFTWVDGTDPAWLSRKRAALEAAAGERMPEAAADDLRFVGHDELRHSLRSLEQYAPWVRHVYVVTDRQRPEWLREDSDWVSIVDHRDIAPEGTVLPTFNSQAIEANLHRIEGLSEHFLYFNDDMFLSSPVSPDLFFQANGLSSVYLSRAHVAPGPPIEGEPAPDAAGKNARALIEEVSGRRLSRKLFHAPYALQRSVSYEIEERWPDVIARTRDSQFRRLHDVTLAGGLHLNYAFAVGRAMTRGIRYRYVGIGELTAEAELERLMRDRDSLQTFCLNDAVQEIPPEVADRQVRAFLERRFPDAGSFERIAE